MKISKVVTIDKTKYNFQYLHNVQSQLYIIHQYKNINNITR